jgi:transcriptional regulator with XRE-family HTH domain
MSIAITFGRACRDMRQRLDISQAQLAATVGLSRGYIARIETGAANPTVHQLERIAAAVGLDVALMTTPPVFLSERPRQDLVHARCSMYADRRLSAHAWVDLIAFDPRTGVLLIIEIKTRLDDLGGLERQLGWYERHAARAATALGWRPRTIGTWLLGLASAEVDGACRANRHVFDTSFPGRAPDMLAVSRGAAAPARRSIALIDPTSRRADWLIRTRLDGRRGPAPFDGYADAVRRMKR